jgi:osmoprotectant transport system ATP-binding protein
MLGLSASEYAQRMPSELSGGQRQRVGVARALAARQKVLLMDEPFGALDAITRDALQGEVVRLRDQLGLTIVLVTHDMAEALLLADRIAVLNEGKVEQIAAPSEMMRKPASAYVEGLISTPKRQADRLESIAEGAS